jgi:hypothetical protein
MIAIAPVARTEEIAHETHKAFVAKPGIQMLQKAVFLFRPDIEKLIVCSGLFEQRIILLLGRGRGIVEHDHVHGLPVPSEVIVVGLDRCPDIPQSVGRDDKEDFILHQNFSEVCMFWRAGCVNARTPR